MKLYRLSRSHRYDGRTVKYEKNNNKRDDFIIVIIKI